MANVLLNFKNFPNYFGAIAQGGILDFDPKARLGNMTTEELIGPD